MINNLKAPKLFSVATCTLQSLFLKPPRETKIGSRSRELEKSTVASNYAKLLRWEHFHRNISFLLQIQHFQ